LKVAIASGKGGTGKTTLSTNLAVFLARTEPVVLVDLDVEEPNAGLFVRGTILHEEPRFKRIPEWQGETCSLCGQCQEVCNFNAVLKLGDGILVFPGLCHGCHACSELCPTSSLPMRPRPMGELRHSRTATLDLVESRLRIGEEQAVPLIRQTLGYVDAHFPPQTIRILDAPPGTSCPVIEVVRGADQVILVTEPTPFGLHDLKLAVQTVRELGKEFGVVLNRHGTGDDRVEEYCRAENIELVARIPNRRRIAAIGAAGGLLIEEIPEVAAAVADVARFLGARTKAACP
jgi:MinD superfamily P-loop ATPase